MSPFITTVVIILIIGVIVFLGWWLIIESEGVYLGRRVVIWLYDLFAKRYDQVKQFHPEYDHLFLSQPIMQKIAPIKSPLVLDVATGTGRLPLALVRHSHFQGRVWGADLSLPMLEQALEKFDTKDHVAWLNIPAEKLPFPDNTFDVVTCLEALEFMRNAPQVLNEMVRVLRPGGLLLVSNRIHTRWMPGKTWADDALVNHLRKAGIGTVEIESWQVDYDRVWGEKRGTSLPQLARPLLEVLQCPVCHNTDWDTNHAEKIVCNTCQKRYAVHSERIYLLG